MDYKSPPVSEVLVDWLERKFPNRVPDIEMTDRDVWVAVGIQRVISKLRAESERQSPTAIAEPRSV